MIPIQPTLPISVSFFLGADELEAIAVLQRSLRVDVLRSYQFWESAVARITDGVLTGQSCPWDIELPYGDDMIRIEVKYSREFISKFVAGDRPVFKWAHPKGEGTVKAADVLVLIGVDRDDAVTTWVVPAHALRKCKSLTVLVPRARIGAARSVLDGYQMPLDQMLPEILRAYVTPSPEPLPELIGIT